MHSDLPPRNVGIYLGRGGTGPPPHNVGGYVPTALRLARKMVPSGLFHLLDLCRPRNSAVYRGCLIGSIMATICLYFLKLRGESVC